MFNFEYFINILIIYIKMTPGILTVIVFSIFFTLIIIQFRKIISEKFKIIDHPIEKRKVHAKPTPLMRWNCYRHQFIFN